MQKTAAKPSWYSAYKEHFAYDHRVQRDGFQYIFEYASHRGNHVKDFFSTQVIDIDKTTFGSGFQFAFISLDKNGFNYWETTSQENRRHMAKKWSKPVTKKRVHFARRQNEFIQSLCYLPNKHLYLGAGLDMMVHVYDKALNYLTALPTGERVIRHIVYNSKLDEIVIVGSSGCKSWRLERSFSNGLACYNLHVVRHYTSSGEAHWVSHIEFDLDSQRLICIEDETVSCINCETGELTSVMRNIHDAPLTGCVWYQRR